MNEAAAERRRRAENPYHLPTDLLSHHELAEIRWRLTENPNRYVGDPEAARLDVLRLLNEVEAWRAVEDAAGERTVVFIPDPGLLE